MVMPKDGAPDRLRCRR